MPPGPLDCGTGGSSEKKEFHIRWIGGGGGASSGRLLPGRWIEEHPEALPRSPPALASPFLFASHSSEISTKSSASPRYSCLSV
jgi:hypothetical protein